MNHRELSGLITNDVDLRSYARNVYCHKLLLRVHSQFFLFYRKHRARPILNRMCCTVKQVVAWVVLACTTCSAANQAIQSSTCATPLRGENIMHPDVESAATKSCGSASLGTILSLTHWATLSCSFLESRAQNGSRHMVVRSARNLRTNEHSSCQSNFGVGCVRVGRLKLMMI